jgi:putative peptide zinc metalloprotease protein
VLPEEVERAYAHVVAQLSTIKAAGQKDQTGFWLRFPLASASLVGALARPLSHLFHWAMLPIVTSCAVLCLLLLLRYGLMLNLDPAAFWIAYGLFLLSLIGHELGHASACARYGVPPHTIGIAIYWIYPVFYSDVSAAWQLTRWQRVVVDLGGVFFQLLIGGLYALLYLVSRYEAAYVALLMIVYSCLFSLNPILKFDGYWVLADALGVTNLGKQPGRVLRYSLGRLRGQSIKPLPWPTHITILMAGYTVVSVGFWLYFTGRLIPFLWSAWLTYPVLLAGLLQQLLRAPRAISTEQIQSLATATFTIGIALLMTSRLAQMALRPALSFARQRRGQRRDRMRVQS